ncbi:DnaJ domain-containing protein [Hippea jasoniae]|uniref:DnaJ domain-containing protein n=1 Tax=Hippea jasoniae TaxID=944479 RepID=UPI000553C7F3|nr:DnaJ domain-containing protein [Hippea jasoniae]
MDPYEVLGVDRSASFEQIRKVFLSLAKQLHPDTAIDEADRIAKEKRFKEISYAYSLIKEGKVADINDKVKDEKDNLEYIKKKANYFIKKGDYNAAIDLLRPKEDEMDFECNMLLGIALLNKNRLHQALKYFKRSLDLNPWDALPYVYIGMVYEKSRLKESAVKYYKEALKIDPSNKMASEALEKLERKNPFAGLGKFFKK